LYQGSKPVMWSPVEQTALAEAEVEYHDKDSFTIWVKFRVAEVSSREDYVDAVVRAEQDKYHRSAPIVDIEKNTVQVSTEATDRLLEMLDFDPRDLLGANVVIDC